MKAAWYDTFKGPISIKEIPDPQPGPDDVIIKVMATGICRSDWHGWQGHDSDIRLPHVPGHELAGVIALTGKNIRNWKVGDRVTVPFCLGCGVCTSCGKGQQQICDNYHQPGFTGWGSFATHVRIPYAATNLVKLPDSIPFTTAALLGCRYITAWRGLYHQAALQPGETIAVYGCGGVGLAAIQIAAALGAKPLAVDIDEQKLALAKQLGATAIFNARTTSSVEENIKQYTNGGTDASVDALGSRETCRNALLSLRKQGRHIQLGLLAGAEKDPPLPMSEVIGRELQIIGSHGMQAHEYPALLKFIEEGRLAPQLLLGKKVTLEEGVEELMQMGHFPGTGVTVIEFS